MSSLSSLISSCHFLSSVSRLTSRSPLLTARAGKLRRRQFYSQPLENGRVLSQGSTFTYQDVLDELLVYTPDGLGLRTDEVRFSVTDGVHTESGRLEFTMDVKKSETPRATINRGLQMAAGEDCTQGPTLGPLLSVKRNKVRVGNTAVACTKVNSISWTLRINVLYVLHPSTPSYTIDVLSGYQTDPYLPASLTHSSHKHTGHVFISCRVWLVSYFIV